MGKRRILTLTSFSLLLSFCFCGLAFANGNAGEAQPGGGGCYNPSTMSYSSYNDTCYGGISWRFYTLNGGNYNTSTDSYTISAGNSGSTTISGCNGTDGYWLLAYERYNTKSSYPYVSSYIGSQRGAVKLSVSAHWSSGYARDATLSGSGFPSFPGKVYTSASDFKANGIKNGSVGSWDMVAGLFAEMPSQYKNGHSWSSSDDLAWFCYSPDVTTPGEYYTSSHASNRDSADATSGGGYQTTGIVNTAKTATTPTRQINVGATAPVTFSHDIYSTTSKTGVSWKVCRTMNGGSFLNSAYSVSTPSSGSLSANSTNSCDSGTTNINVDRGSSEKPRYKTSEEYTDGGAPHFYRNYYKITFKQAGTYKFCETIYVDGKQYTTSCSTIKVGSGTTEDPSDCASWTPSSYTSSSSSRGTTSVIAAVKNDSVDRYNSWVKSSSSNVYAKPGDNLSFLHCYYPGVQYTYNTIVTKNNSHPHPSTLPGNVNSLTNVELSSFVSWGNYFKVSNSNLKSENKYSSGDYGKGQTDTRSWNDSYLVETGSRSRVGLTLGETNTSSSPTYANINSGKSCVWDCNAFDCEPYDCHCTGEGKEKTCDTCYKTCYEDCYHDKDYIGYSVTTSSVSDTATVKVPYNFINTASASILDDIAYAGESVVMSGDVYVNQKTNNTTDGTYATRVDGAEARLIVYSSKTNNWSPSDGYGSYSSNLCGYFSSATSHGNCNEALYYSGSLNNPEDVGGSSEDNLLYGTVNVYDVPAGEYICAATAVYPANSGSDTNMSASGSNSWYISAPSCLLVAKKPTFQVWGGSFYSASGVATKTSPKKHIAGYYSYRPTNGTTNAVFSSWAELAVVSNGTVSNLASGAATGYTFSNRSAYGYVSGISIDPCQRARLSFANTICNSGTTGSSGIAPDYSIKADIIKRYATADKYVGNTVTLGAKTIPRQTTDVTYANGVNITGNIVYEDMAYVSVNQLPQAIIYSKGDINISCDVTRIDAWLIADGTIYTCSTATQTSKETTSGLIFDDSGERSYQLKFNGVVIANKLVLGRTYGAATGKNSGEAAEIFNLSVTSYFWANSGATNTPKLYTTYLRELAPRY